MRARSGGRTILTPRSYTWSARTPGSGTGAAHRRRLARRCGCRASTRLSTATPRRATAGTRARRACSGTRRRRPSTAGWRSRAPSAPPTPREMRRSAEEAHAIALTTGDRDLEAAALARVGYAVLAGGEVRGGTDRLDEAMAAATGGDVGSLDVDRRHHVRRDRGVRALGGLAADRAVGPGDGCLDPEP